MAEQARFKPNFSALTLTPSGLGHREKKTILPPCTVRITQYVEANTYVGGEPKSLNRVDHMLNKVVPHGVIDFVVTNQQV